MKIDTEVQNDCLVVKLRRGLDFPGAEFIEEKLIDLTEANRKSSRNISTTYGIRYKK